MLVNMIKCIIDKVKFKFNGAQNQEFVFESNIEIPFSDPGEIETDKVEEKYIDAIELADIDLSRKDTTRLKKLNKVEKYYIYISIADREKWHLVRILLRAKKSRVRKKLVKRILE